MALNILAIVEYGVQKQRLSLDVNSSYRDICDQIYLLFNLDSTKSKYILQRQDSLKPGSYKNVEERSFLNDLKTYATKNIKSPVIRLRLVPATSKNKLKPANGHVNGEKAWSTSSQCQQDENDRASTTSATTIDIKQLIKKCLVNLRETTDNIQLLDRYLHPEDYVDDDCQSTNKSISIQQSPASVNPPIKRQMSQTSSISDSRMSSSNIVDELVPVLNQLMNTQQALPVPLSPSTNKLVETLPVIPQTTVNNEVQITVNYKMQTPTPNTNGSSRSSNKSFSNRLGMMLPSNQAQNSIVQEPKPVPTLQQYVPPKPKSPAPVKQTTVISYDEKPIETSSSTETLGSSKSKCQIELKQYEPSSSIEGIVSVASNASYFFLQVIDEKKDEFDHLSKILHEHYSNLDKNSQYRPSPGDFCVAMYTEDARWYRARIIRYISEQTCEVFYVDYGNMEELPIDLLHEMLPEFVRMPARAIACTIAEILPPNGQEGWTKRATFAFASRCSNERVQATVIESTRIKWPMHIVQLRVSKTQEDIGASLENCKVARRVSNKEICEFWSNKIRLEQFVLYNIQEPDPNRFPVIEQGTSSCFHYMTTNQINFSPSNIINMFDEKFHSNIDKVSKDLAFVHRN